MMTRILHKIKLNVLIRLVVFVSLACLPMSYWRHGLLVKYRYNFNVTPKIRHIYMSINSILCESCWENEFELEGLGKCTWSKNVSTIIKRQNSLCRTGRTGEIRTLFRWPCVCLYVTPSLPKHMIYVYNSKTVTWTSWILPPFWNVSIARI